MSKIKKYKLGKLFNVTSKKKKKEANKSNQLPHFRPVHASIWLVNREKKATLATSLQQLTRCLVTGLPGELNSQQSQAEAGSCETLTPPGPCRVRAPHSAHYTVM